MANGFGWIIYTYLSTLDPLMIHLLGTWKDSTLAAQQVKGAASTMRMRIRLPMLARGDPYRECENGILSAAVRVVAAAPVHDDNLQRQV